MIIEEGEHFGNFLGQYEGVNKGKPYTTTDLILDCIPGIYNPYDTPIASFYRDIKKIYLKPILKSVWNFIPKDWDKSWIARYRRNEQDYLKFHTDASTCASIISLNDDYEGGGTIFKRQKKRIDREAMQVAAPTGPQLKVGTEIVVAARLGILNEVTRIVLKE